MTEEVQRIANTYITAKTKIYKKTKILTLESCVFYNKQILQIPEHIEVLNLHLCTGVARILCPKLPKKITITEAQESVYIFKRQNFPEKNTSFPNHIIIWSDALENETEIQIAKCGTINNIWLSVIKFKLNVSKCFRLQEIKASYVTGKSQMRIKECAELKTVVFPNSNEEILFEYIYCPNLQIVDGTKVTMHAIGSDNVYFFLKHHDKATVLYLTDYHEEEYNRLCFKTYNFGFFRKVDPRWLRKLRHFAINYLEFAECEEFDISLLGSFAVETLLISGSNIVQKVPFEVHANEFKYTYPSDFEKINVTYKTFSRYE